MVEKMDVYMVVLEGQGDIWVRLVDEENFDLLVPDNVRKKLWEESNKTQYGKQIPVEEYKVFITRGSYNNDRALEVEGLVINEEKADFYDEDDAKEFALKHNLTIKDTYEGCIY